MFLSVHIYKVRLRENLLLVLILTRIQVTSLGSHREPTGRNKGLTLGLYTVFQHPKPKIYCIAKVTDLSQFLVTRREFQVEKIPSQQVSDTEKTELTMRWTGWHDFEIIRTPLTMVTGTGRSQVLINLLRRRIDHQAERRHLQRMLMLLERQRQRQEMQRRREEQTPHFFVHCDLVIPMKDQNPDVGRRFI
jgi:hypothetical protein